MRLEGFEFSDDAVLDALKGVGDENGTQGFDFDFDDSDEQIIEEEAIRSYGRNDGEQNTDKLLPKY